MIDNIIYTYTFEEYRSMIYLANKWDTRKHKYTFMLFLIPLLLFEIILLDAWYTKYIELFCIFFWGLLGLFIFILFMRLVHSKNVILENYKKCKENVEHYIVIDDEIIESKNKYTTIALPWEEITNVDENNVIILFRITTKYQLVLPKRILSPENVKAIENNISRNSITRTMIK
jgi:YcxB-like protein